MKTSKFTKNDKPFTCVRCGYEVTPLGYTSRDHCPNCLTSLHVDVNPGDRANLCMGTMTPVDISFSNKKGIVIEYECDKCGEHHNNKAAEDDNFEIVLSVSNHTYKHLLKNLKK